MPINPGIIGFHPREFSYETVAGRRNEAKTLVLRIGMNREYLVRWVYTPGLENLAG